MAVILMLAIVLCHIADVLLTEHGIKHGLREGNWLYRGKDGSFVLWRAIALKSVFVVLAAWYHDFLPVLVVSLAVAVLPIAWNVYKTYKRK